MPSPVGARGCRRRRGPILLALLALVTAVATGLVFGGAAATSNAPPDRAEPPATMAAPPSSPPTTAAPTTTAPPPSVCDRRAELDTGSDPVPPALAQRLDAALADSRWAGLDRSLSVWVEGYGLVVAVGADTALLPASNQKLLTAIGAHLLLGPDTRFRTEVRRVGDGVVVVAGGDPTLRSSGPHSLTELARQVRSSGIRQVAHVAVDASRFEPATTARGWQDWQVPTYAGPMSAFVVDDNRGRSDPAYLDDPALGNAEAFAAALRAKGVRAPGPVGHGSAELLDPVVAAVESATVAELTRTMLLRSDNEIAESLVRVIGDGSTDAGLARIHDALAPWCLHLTGESGDGSGLSRADLRSANEWRRLLQVAAEQPWGPELRDALPVAGVSGTLSGRLGAPPTGGNVAAKTGTIIGGTALGGHATTTDGRDVVFSLVVNGEPAASQRATGALDHLVAAVVAG